MSFVATRKIDQLGRILIPIDIRRYYGMLPGEDVRIALKGEEVIISRAVTETSGIIKKVDRTGRIVIPKSIRKTGKSRVKIIPCEYEIHLIFDE